MVLTGKQKHQLRALAHHKKPVVMVGDAGLTEAVMAEIEQALAHHELIKIRLRAEREDRTNMIIAICETTGAEAVQRIGQIAVLYRAATPPVIVLP